MPGNVVLVGGVRTAVGKFGHGLKDVPAQNPASQAVIYAGIPRHSIIFWYVNHREHRGHREKWQRSVLSECSVVDYLYKYSFFLQRMCKTIINLPFTQKEIRRLLPALYQMRCAQGLP